MKDNILESQRRQVDTVASAMEARLERLAEPMILLAGVLGLLPGL